VKDPLAEFNSFAPSPAPTVDCVDDANCPDYAASGQCDHDILSAREQIRKLCPIACGICASPGPSVSPSAGPVETSDLCNIAEIISVSNNYPDSNCQDYIQRINIGLISTDTRACEDCLSHWSESDASRFQCRALEADNSTVYEIWSECEEPDPLLCTTEELEGLETNFPIQCWLYANRLKSGAYSSIERELRCNCLNATSMEYLEENANCYPTPDLDFTLPELKNKCEYDICDPTLLGLQMNEYDEQCDAAYTRLTTGDQSDAFESANWWALICPCLNQWPVGVSRLFNCLVDERHDMTLLLGAKYCESFKIPTIAPVTSAPTSTKPSIAPITLPTKIPSALPTMVNFICISGRRGTREWVNGQYERKVDDQGELYWESDSGSFIFFSSRWDVTLISREYKNELRLFVSLSSNDLNQATVQFWNDATTETVPDPYVNLNTDLCNINSFNDFCFEGFGFDGRYVYASEGLWNAEGSRLENVNGVYKVFDSQQSVQAQCVERPDQCTWTQWNDAQWAVTEDISVRTSRCFLSQSASACVVGSDLYDGQYEHTGENEGMPIFQSDSYMIYFSDGSWYLGESLDSSIYACDNSLGHACYWLQDGVVLPELYILGGACDFSSAPTTAPSEVPSPSEVVTTITPETTTTVSTTSAGNDKIPSFAPSLSCEYLLIETEVQDEDFNGVYAISGTRNDALEWMKDSHHMVFYSPYQGSDGWILLASNTALEGGIDSTDGGFLRHASHNPTPPEGQMHWDYHEKGSTQDVRDRLVDVTCITSADSLPPTNFPTTSIPSPKPSIITIKPSTRSPTFSPTSFSEELGIENHIYGMSSMQLDDQYQWAKVVAAVLTIGGAEIDELDVRFIGSSTFNDGQDSPPLRRRMVELLKVQGYVRYRNQEHYTNMTNQLRSENGVGYMRDRMDGMMQNEIFGDARTTWFGLIGDYKFPPTSAPTDFPTPEPTTEEDDTILITRSTNTSSNDGLGLEEIFYILIGVCFLLCCILFWLWLFLNNRNIHSFEDKETIIFPPIKEEVSDSETSLGGLVPFDYSGCTREQLRQHLTECEQTLNYIEQQLHTLFMNNKRDPAKDPEIKTLSREQRRVDLNIMTLLKLLYPEDSPEELKARRGRFWNGEGLESDDESSWQQTSDAGAVNTNIHMHHEELIDRASEDRDRQSSMGGKRKREAGYFVETEYVYRNRSGDHERRHDLDDVDVNSTFTEDEFLTPGGNFNSGDDSIADDTELNAWEEFLRDKREKIFELEEHAALNPKKISIPNDMIQADLTSEFDNSQSSEIVDPAYRIIADPTYYEEPRYDPNDYVSDNQSVHSMNHLQGHRYAGTVTSSQRHYETQSNQSFPLGAYAASKRHPRGRHLHE